MPVGLRRLQVSVQNFAARPHGDGGRGRIQMRHEERSLAGDAQPFPLADGEGRDAAMSAQGLAAGINNGTWPQSLGATSAQIGHIVVVGNEADLLAVGLGVHRQAHGTCLRTHIFLAGHVAQGKQYAPQELACNSEQHVGLVLVPRRLAQDRWTTANRQNARIVAGGHPRNPQGVRMTNEPAELDLGVAWNTGIGRAAAPVFVDEILDDRLECVREVQHVELDAQLVRHRARVRRVLRRAASARVAVRIAGRTQTHEHACDLEARSAQQPGRHRGIDPAAHGNQHPLLAIDHLAHPLATPCRETPGPREARARGSRVAWARA